jgi:4-alpha-glucanotransferase
VGRNDPAGRLAGIVLHPTSLVGAYGTGDLGLACFSFIDWLASAGMKAWQVLPLVPPDEDYFSPYSGQDALCGNPLLISLEALVEKGLLEKGVVLG